MRNIFLYAREADTDLAGRRFKLGIAVLRGLELFPSGRLERSYASVNDLCAAVQLAVDSSIDKEVEKLRRELDCNFDFVLMVTEAEAERLGFCLKEDHGLTHDPQSLFG